MSLVAEFSLPPKTFPGGTTLEAFETARLRFERVVPTSQGPCPSAVVVYTDPLEVIDEFRNESDIAAIEVVAVSGRYGHVQLEWSSNVEVINRLESTDSTVLKLTGRADGWTLQVRSPNRRALRAFQQLFTDDVSVDVRYIHDISRDDQQLSSSCGSARTSKSEATGFEAFPYASTRAELTPKQQETLITAYREGYFDRPRGITQAELGEEFGISRRAVSDRLRRGMKSLLEPALMETEDITDCR